MGNDDFISLRILNPAVNVRECFSVQHIGRKKLGASFAVAVNEAV